MQNYYRLEERAPQAGSIGDTQKSAQRHPSIFSTDAPLLPKLGYSPLPRIVRGKPAIDGKNLPKQLAEFFADRHENDPASFRAWAAGFSGMANAGASTILATIEPPHSNCATKPQRA